MLWYQLTWYRIIPKLVAGREYEAFFPPLLTRISFSIFFLSNSDLFYNYISNTYYVVRGGIAGLRGGIAGLKGGIAGLRGGIAGLGS
jgi:hypothetical protein